MSEENQPYPVPLDQMPPVDTLAEHGAKQAAWQAATEAAQHAERFVASHDGWTTDAYHGKPLEHAVLTIDPAVSAVGTVPGRGKFVVTRGLHGEFGYQSVEGKRSVGNETFTQVTVYDADGTARSAHHRGSDLRKNKEDYRAAAREAYEARRQNEVPQYAATLALEHANLPEDVAKVGHRNKWSDKVKSALFGKHVELDPNAVKPADPNADINNAGPRPQVVRPRTPER